MNPLMPYYRKQLLIALWIGGLFALLAGQWLTGLVVAAWSIGFAVWAPRSGRFVVDPSRGADAVSQDERSRAIGARASEIALGVVIFGCGALWYGLRVAGVETVPTDWVAYLTVFGVGTQVATDSYLRSR